MPPKISVIIATYYRNSLLRDAIESVLEQEYDPVELIVVDDSGVSHAKPVLEEYDDVTPIYRAENGDWAAAYTDGIRAATGEYIHPLDDDDYFLPGKLEKTARALEREPDAGVAYSGLVSDVRGEQYPDPEVSGDVIERALRFDTYPCCTITMLIERDVLLDALPLATYADDLDLKIKLARRTRFTYVDECLVFRRKTESRKWHGLNMFEEMHAILRERAALYDEYPLIRRELLAALYEDEGQLRLETAAWSPQAITCFLKAAYYADETRFRCAGQAVAAVFGRPGLDAARTARDLVFGPPPGRHHETRTGTE